jgi:hypothetical protein
VKAVLRELVAGGLEHRLASDLRRLPCRLSRG